MANLVYQSISMTPSVTQTPVTPDTGGTETSGGNTVPPNERGFLEFENTNASARTITLYVPATAGLDAYGVTFSDLPYSLGATTGRKRIGPLDRRFAQADGLIHFTIDANAGVTVGAYLI
jgi:hypothetical protein